MANHERSDQEGGRRVLIVSEHQSTINENMPLRSIIYYGRTAERMIDPRAIYKTGRISLLTPEFYTFYNGTEPFPREKILRLSDAYLEKTDEPMLELVVRVININLYAGHPLVSKCPVMYEYSWFIQRIRERMAERGNRDEAIRMAMEDCIRQGMLTDFLREHGTEAVNMLYTQFNWDDALKVRGEEKFAEGESRGIKIGILRGKAEAILDILSELGNVPDHIAAQIMEERNVEKQKLWLKEAARAESLEQFIKVMILTEV